MRREFLIALGLILVTLLPYWQVLHHDFIFLDDGVYITENTHVQAGLTATGVVRAFSTGYAGNWHPLTWLSHMLDCQLYGLDPAGHHLTSLILHIANTLLLFVVFKRMTGSAWRSAFLAAFFAFHPLHVESVAWAAERKDVLSTFFWMLTMWAYVAYVEHPQTRRYVLAVICFSLGLMAKPMLVTLPFVLLLLDYWPLGRFPGTNGRNTPPRPAVRGPRAGNHTTTPPKLLQEKLPFLALAIASSATTLYFQQHGGAVRSLEFVSLGTRIANALVAYVTYIAKTIWPSHLAVYYPHPLNTLPAWQVAGSALLLLIVSGVVLRHARARPFLAVGWLWYLGTLVPVIGLVQVGNQALADRYTYVPLIGLSILAAWSVPQLGRKWSPWHWWSAASAAGVLLALLICTWSQLRYWQDGITLYEHTGKVTANNWVVHTRLGVALFAQGKTDEAIAHYSEALRIKPEFAEVHNNLGFALATQGKLPEAIAQYAEALRIEPEYADAHNNMGVALAMEGRTEEAIPHFAEAIGLNPKLRDAHYNMGLALAAEGRVEDAVAEYRKALAITPGDREVLEALRKAERRQDGPAPP